jgi:hypothetical protein
MLTELKYKTFDELVEDVSVDFSMYSLEGMIEPQQLIKVVQRINYDLGLKIFKTNEEVLEIENYLVRLPDDFYVMNYALLCGSYKIQEPAMSGTTVEEVILDPKTITNPCDTSTCLTNCGDHMRLVQKLQYETRIYDINTPISLSGNSKSISCDCPNTSYKSPYNGILKDGFIRMNLETGKLYINYQGALEDADGNLLILDHPMINEYYEYGLKQRILENLYMNGEDVIQKLNLIEQRFKGARNNALSIVNTPNFKELSKMHDMNRRAMYNKYYDQFKSYNYNSSR